MQLNNTELMIIGALAVMVAGAIVKQWFTTYVNKKFDAVYTRQEKNETERERDNFITMRGQQVTCDCLHQLTLTVLKGDHVEELEAANRELDEYRALLNKTIMEKAARWSNTIQR